MDIYERLCQAANEESEKINVKICFAFVDSHGNLVYFRRFEDSLLASIDIAIKKAYSSVALKMETSKIAKLSEPGGIFYGINTLNPGYVAFGGGYPLYKDGKLIGAIGVSGGSDVEDEQIGNKVVEVFKKEF